MKYKVLKNEDSDAENEFELTTSSTIRARNNADQNSSRSTSSKNNNSQHDKFKFIEYTIDHKNNETLNSIALNFRCDVNDLKRCNNIHSSTTSFHALKTIKIPVSKYSSLLDNTENQNNEDGARSPTSNSTSSLPTIEKIIRKNEKTTQEILKKSNDQIESIHQQVQNLAPSAFSNGPILAPISSMETDQFINQYRDANTSESILCNWKVLVILLVVGLLVGPLVYGYIFYEEHEAALESASNDSHIHDSNTIVQNDKTGQG